MIIHSYHMVNSQLIVDLAKQALTNVRSADIKELKDSYPHCAFRDRFGRVKISLPRGSGHTTAALQLLYEFSDALLFVSKSSRKAHCQHLLHEYVADAAVRKRIEDAILYTTGTDLISIRPIEDRSFIIIDQAYEFTRDTINLIDQMVGYNAGIFVELN